MYTGPVFDSHSKQCVSQNGCLVRVYTAPTYNSAGSFMRGTLTEITLGDYLDRQEGFLSSVNLSWETGYPWEIDLDNEQLPKVPTILNVECSFTPIHKFNATAVPNLSSETYFGSTKLSV